MRTNFNNCKVRIANEEESRKVQERLFDLGYSTKGNNIKPWDKDFIGLVMHPNKYLAYCDLNLWWIMEGKTFEEVTVADILGEESYSYKIKVDDKEAAKGIITFKYEGEPGSFMWAVEQMKQGKKVRRKEGRLSEYFLTQNDEGRYLMGEEGAESSSSWYVFSFEKEDFEATDWEYYEEPKKTLWDKKEDCQLKGSQIGFCGFHELHVKEALQSYTKEVYELRKRTLDKGFDFAKGMDELNDKHFGEQFFDD